MSECRYCHCTETRACVAEDGPCYWHRPGYCSACAEKHLEQLLEAANWWGENRPGGEHPVVFAGRAWRVGTGDAGMIVFDHIGVPVFGFNEEGAFLAPHYDAPELLPLFQEAGRAAA